jgi:multiple sugar transport system permease protein
VFFAFPLLQAFLLAFRTPEGELTLKYFTRISMDIYFEASIKNLFLLIATILPLQLLAALAISLLVNSRFRGSTMFLYICATPLAISELAAGFMWLSIFTERGYLNTLLSQLGLIKHPIIYLSKETLHTTFVAIVLAETWRATAIVMVILVAGLQMISRDYFETADIFGASWFQKLRYVTLPLLKPSLQSALIIRTVFAVQVFATIIALGGGLLPVPATQAFLWQTWYYDPHLAASYGILIMIISTAFTLLYITLLRPRVEVAAA